MNSLPTLWSHSASPRYPYPTIRAGAFLVQRVPNRAPHVVVLEGRDFTKSEDAEAFAKRFGGEQFQAGAIKGQQ